MTNLNGQDSLVSDSIHTKPKKEAVYSFLADIVYVFHILVVLFVLIAPFLNIPYFLILHFTFCVSLLVHWWGNSNVCSLSVIESKLRGLNYTESFTHKFVAPIYDISKTTWSRTCYIMTILLLSISAYKIYQSPKWKETIQCYYNVNDSIRKDPVVRELPMYKKILMYFQCVKVLFTV
jgi:hypothetical protein